MNWGIELAERGRLPEFALRAGIRSLLARFVKISQAVVHVLAYEEIPDNKQITVVSTIGRTG